MESASRLPPYLGGTMSSPNCSCLDDDRYVCWADRNNLGMCNANVVEQDGGPCECACHDDYEICDDEQEEQ